MKIRTHYILILIFAVGAIFSSEMSILCRRQTIEAYKKSLDMRWNGASDISLVFDEYLHVDTIFLNKTCIKLPTYQMGFADRDYKDYSVDKFIIGCPHLSNHITDEDYIAVNQICKIAGYELGDLLHSPNFIQNILSLYSEHVYLPIAKKVFGKLIFLNPEGDASECVVQAVKLNNVGLIKEIFLNNGQSIYFKSEDDSTYVGQFRSFESDIDTSWLHNRYYYNLKHFGVLPPSESETNALVKTHIDKAISILTSEKFYVNIRTDHPLYCFEHIKSNELPHWITAVEFLSIFSFILLIILCVTLYKRKKWLNQNNEHLTYIHTNFPKSYLHYNLPECFSDDNLTDELENLMHTSNEHWVELEGKLNLQEEQHRHSSIIKRECPNGYKIACARANIHTDQEILENEELIREEEIKYRKHLRISYSDTTKELTNAESRFTESLNGAKSALINGSIEDAMHGIEQSKALLHSRSEILTKQSQIADSIRIATGEIMTSRNSHVDLEDLLTETVKAIDETYSKGISVPRDVLYVKYDCKDSILKQDDQDWTYPSVRFPSNGCVVFPHRRRKIARRGYMEARFEEMVRENFTSDILEVIGDANILLTDGCRPYEPDIAIIEKGEKYNLRIDIEIDEPYAGLTGQATHYIGCGDYTRDMNLVSAGWIVVRFNEEAIVKNHMGCLSYIAQIIEEIIPSYRRPEHLKCNYPTCKRWNEIEAKIMAANKYRESYLGIHSFGELENGSLKGVDITQNETEKKALKEIKSYFIPNTKQKNLDKSKITFDNDNRLVFEPSEHTYIYDGTIELRAVSNIISLFFETFDAVGNAVRMGRRDGVSPDYYLELWDRKGSLSREVGTFMHQQIENIIKGKQYKNTYHFKYNNEIETVDIQKEIDFFLSFMEDTSIQPFRTEWAICDNEYKIAGTIDCLCKNGDSYEIYDWKRSSKVIDYYGDPILENNWGHIGYGPIKHIHDTSFWRYALQQNIYKFILEKNYGIKISAMKILVLHADYDMPYLLDIPNLGTEVIQMLEIIKNKVK